MKSPKDYPDIQGRIDNCPIHQWAGSVVGFARSSGVPEDVIPVFQELVLLRGEYPVEMTENQIREFGRRSRVVGERYKVNPSNVMPLQIVLGGLFQQWVNYKRNLH